MACSQQRNEPIQTDNQTNAVQLNPKATKTVPDAIGKKGGEKDKQTPSKMHPRLRQYDVQANLVMKAIAEGKKSEAIGGLAKDLMKTGTALLPEFIQKHPMCKNYLETLLAAAPDMVNLSLEAIERDYHADGQLPKSPNERCYHAKDLVVHPATVIVLSRAGFKSSEDRDKATAEIAEVLAHLGQVNGYL